MWLLQGRCMFHSDSKWNFIFRFANKKSKRRTVILTILRPLCYGSCICLTVSQRKPCFTLKLVTGEQHVECIMLKVSYELICFPHEHRFLPKLNPEEVVTSLVNQCDFLYHGLLSAAQTLPSPNIAGLRNLKCVVLSKNSTWLLWTPEVMLWLNSPYMARTAFGGDASRSVGKWRCC